MAMQSLKTFLKKRSMFSYIANSLKYKYIKLSKKYTNLYLNELEFKEKILNETNSFDIETHIMLNTFWDKLPSSQKKVLNELYINGYTVSEVAKKLHISRQAVNKTKNKGLNSLRKYLQGHYYLT